MNAPTNDGVHLRHCYQGECEDVCKYGELDCPAKPTPAPQTTVRESLVKELRDFRGWVGLTAGDSYYKLPPSQQEQLDESVDAILAIFTQSLEGLKKALPQNRQYKEAQDITDHWGMTENSIARQLDNMKGLGFNEALDEVNAAVDKLLAGIRGEG